MYDIPHSEDGIIYTVHYGTLHVPHVRKPPPSLADKNSSKPSNESLNLDDETMLVHVTPDYILCHLPWGTTKWKPPVPIHQIRQSFITHASSNHRYVSVVVDACEFRIFESKESNGKLDIVGQLSLRDLRELEDDVTVTIEDFVMGDSNIYVQFFLFRQKKVVNTPAFHGVG